MSVSVHLELSGDLQYPAHRNVAEEIVSAVESILAKVGSHASALELKQEIRDFLGDQTYRLGTYKVELHTTYHVQE